MRGFPVFDLDHNTEPLEARRGERQRLARDLGQIAVGDAQPRQPRKEGELLHQPSQALDLLENRRPLLTQSAVEVGRGPLPRPPQVLDREADGGQGIAHLVRDPARHLLPRGDPLRREASRFAFRQGLEHP